MHEVLVNRLGGLSLPRKSVVRLTDRPDMTLDVYHGRKTTMQQQQQNQIFRSLCILTFILFLFCRERLKKWKEEKSLSVKKGQKQETEKKRYNAS